MINKNIRNDFPILDKITYLDSASTSLTPIQVVEAMNEYFFDYNANTGRGAYKTAIRSSNEIQQTREKLSNLINAKYNEIIFTLNTTSAINLVVNGFPFISGDEIIISDVEHHSNYVNWLYLVKNNNLKLKIIKTNEFGEIDSEELSKMLTRDTKFVSLAHVSNSIGSVNNIEKISKVVHENPSTYLLLDVAQSIGHIPIDNSKIKADFIASPCHKGILAPTGVGFLYCREELQKILVPSNLGGGTVFNIINDKPYLLNSPERFEGGTQNIAGIIGTGTALDYINDIKIKNIEIHSKKLTKQLFNELSQFENIEIYSNPNNLLNLISFNIKGLDCQDVSMVLDNSGDICVRSGVHCAIPAINKLELKTGTVRASLGVYNNIEDIYKLVEVIEDNLIF
jgi:cysteine desulfurase/selenocysteine lyase